MPYLEHGGKDAKCLPLFAISRNVVRFLQNLNKPFDTALFYISFPSTFPTRCANGTRRRSRNRARNSFRKTSATSLLCNYLFSPFSLPLTFSQYTAGRPRYPAVGTEIHRVFGSFILWAFLAIFAMFGKRA